MTVICVD